LCIDNIYIDIELHRGAHSDGSAEPFMQMLKHSGVSQTAPEAALSENTEAAEVTEGDRRRQSILR